MACLPSLALCFTPDLLASASCVTRRQVSNRARPLALVFLARRPLYPSAGRMHDTPLSAQPCASTETNMLKPRNADVAAVAVKAVEGKPMYGGDMLVKPL